MNTIDHERLEQMRAYAEEIREDLERRELEDPIIDVDVTVHREPPAIIHKTIENRVGNSNTVSDAPAAPFDDDQIDIVARVIAEIRHDTQDAIADATAPLQQRIAMLEGQISMLTTLLGGDASRSLEASEVVRKIRVSR